LAAGGSSLSSTPPPRDNGQTGPKPTLTPRARALVREGLGRQDAYLLASKALLLRLHSRMDAGVPSETEAALVRGWFRLSATALDEFESSLRMQLALAGRQDARSAPATEKPPTTYEAFLAASNPYDSGDFLEQPTNLHRPRFVPEMIDADPALAARN